MITTSEIIKEANIETMAAIATQPIAVEDTRVSDRVFVENTAVFCRRMTGTSETDRRCAPAFVKFSSDRPQMHRPFSKYPQVAATSPSVASPTAVDAMGAMKNAVLL